MVVSKLDHHTKQNGRPSEHMIIQMLWKKYSTKYII